jgi:thiosulfate reductase cytochrome b subunit
MTDKQINLMENLCGAVLMWVAIVFIICIVGFFIYHVYKILKDDRT